MVKCWSNRSRQWVCATLYCSARTRCRWCVEMLALQQRIVLQHGDLAACLLAHSSGSGCACALPAARALCCLNFYTNWLRDCLSCPWLRLRLHTTTSMCPRTSLRHPSAPLPSSSSSSSQPGRRSWACIYTSRCIHTRSLFNTKRRFYTTRCSYSKRCICTKRIHINTKEGPRRAGKEWLTLPVVP